jgi:hypothetical protein
MEKHQPKETHQESRRTAAQAFMESLDQLGQRLQFCEDESGEIISSKPNSLSQSTSGSQAIDTQAIDTQALEDAAADIEQFMQMMQTENISNMSASGSDFGSDSPTPQG